MRGISQIIMRDRNYARERSELHRKVRPLGDFIAGKLREAAAIPVVPRVQPPGALAVTPPRSRREAAVLRDCLKWLHKRGVFAHRENTGTAWIDGQPVSFGYPGAADITGILPDGRRLEVECKSSTGQQSDKQRRYQQRIEENHGIYWLVRSVEELEEKWRQL